MGAISYNAVYKCHAVCKFTAYVKNHYCGATVNMMIASRTTSKRLKMTKMAQDVHIIHMNEIKRMNLVIISSLSPHK